MLSPTKLQIKASLSYNTTNHWGKDQFTAFHYLQLEVTELREQELGGWLDVLLELIGLLPLQLGCQQLDVLLDVANKLLLVKSRLLL